jgi:hypothetical protein
MGISVNDNVKFCNNNGKCYDEKFTITEDRKYFQSEESLERGSMEKKGLFSSDSGKGMCNIKEKKCIIII